MLFDRHANEENVQRHEVSLKAGDIALHVAYSRLAFVAGERIGIRQIFLIPDCVVNLEVPIIPAQVKELQAVYDL